MHYIFNCVRDLKNMETKSKLPLSKLRQPCASVSKIEKKPVVVRPIVNKRKLRQSKSMSDLTCIAITNKPHALKKNVNPQPKTVSKVGTKRIATANIDVPTKPKVACLTKKIPDWDYKTRFNVLSEKHKHLQELYTNLKEQANGLDKLVEQHNVLLAEHEELTNKYQELQETTNKQAERLTFLNNVESDLNALRIAHNDLNKENINTNLINSELNIQIHKLKSSLELETSNNSSLNEHLTKLKEDNNKNETLRRQLHNTIQDLKGNIRVFCRIRPPINEIEYDKLKCLINYPDETSLEIRKSKESISSINGKRTDCKQEFSFDFVFNEESTQMDLFEELAQLVQSAIDGYDVCVFAYGQTGSGKTYTMAGTEHPDHIGMVPRTVNLIFDTAEALRRSNWIYDIKVSFLEIYNEVVRDLLDPNGYQNLDIHFSEEKGTSVTHLKIEDIASYAEFENYAKIAQKNRMVAATDFNEHSSRSHAITKIYLQGRHIDSKTCFRGSVNLVDLAGSESAKTSHGDRLVETKSINKSLSSLGTVMLALHNKDKHIPYRNSKLTYLLKSCLGGNSKTLMIVNISPFEDNYGESVNSLRFASKVKEVKTKIKRNKTAIQAQPMAIDER